MFNVVQVNKKISNLIQNEINDFHTYLNNLTEEDIFVFKLFSYNANEHYLFKKTENNDKFEKHIEDILKKNVIKLQSIYKKQIKTTEEMLKTIEYLSNKDNVKKMRCISEILDFNYEVNDKHSKYKDYDFSFPEDWEEIMEKLNY